MLQFSKFQTFAILGAVLLGALFAVPNFLNEETRAGLPGFVPSSTINLGLDLQGGSYLLLGVDTDKVINDRMTNMTGDIRREMRPISSANRERITIDNIVYNSETTTASLTVADPADADEAADRVRELTRGGVGGALGLGLRPYSVSVNGERIDVTMTTEARRHFSSEAVRDSIEVIRRRIDPAGNREVSIQPQGDDRIVVQVPGDDDPEALKDLINRSGQLSFHRHDPTVNLSDAAAGLLPPGRILVEYAEFAGAGTGEPPLVLWEEPEITGDMVQTASAQRPAFQGIHATKCRFEIRYRAR